MKTYSVMRSDTGEFTGLRMAGDDKPLLAQSLPEGCDLYEGEYDHLSQRVDLETGEVVDWQPPAPPDDAMQTWTWDTGVKRWRSVPTLAALRIARKDVIDAGRVTRTLEPIAFAGAQFDADETAMRNIAGWQTQIAAGVALPPGFVWRDAANNDHPADAAFVNGMGEAITMRGTVLYATAWALKAAIDAATTKEEAEGVTWPA